MRSRIRCIPLLLLAVAACEDGAPAPTAPDEVQSTSTELIPRSIMEATHKAASPGLPIGPLRVSSGTVVYDFNDITGSCVFDHVLASTYADLVFIDTPYLAPCAAPPAFDPSDVALIPDNSSGGTFDRSAVYEIRIQLPAQASSVSISSWVYFDVGVTPELIAYDASGAVLGSGGAATPNAWETFGVTATGIDHIGLRSGQGMNYWDNLTIDYVVDPVTKDDCKNGGWESYGFRNQGQCVRFVETGKDSR